MIRGAKKDYAYHCHMKRWIPTSKKTYEDPSEIVSRIQKMNLSASDDEASKDISPEKAEQIVQEIVAKSFAKISKSFAKISVSIAKFQEMAKVRPMTESMLPQFSPLYPFPRLTLFSLCRLLGHNRHPVLVAICSEGGSGSWKLADIDSGFAILKAQTLLVEVASSLVKPGQRGKHATDKDPGDMVVKEEIFIASELTVNRDTPNGYLSFAAAISIEQFGRSVEDERFDGAEDAEDIQSACPH
ncbi:hypothetical protein ZIOFF_010901 [Zingiber officinale]|uniref:Uncharacterized protein n=1 Tax=Zingiber officinale TaxID=94328 RepID=A0A8J5HWJ1_ZINOF|nr:hypothetical protein ZIOFF_010901 [Zingiber officinale]